MKTLRTFFLFALMIALSAFGAALAEEEEVQSYTCEDYKYILNDDGTATITDYTRHAHVLEITDTLDGHNVTSVGDFAFSDSSSLTQINIPDSVTSIGDLAFFDCSDNLTLTVGRDSYAAQYAKDNGLAYTYSDANDWLLS